MKQKSIVVGSIWGLFFCCAFVFISPFAHAQTPRQSTNPKALKKYNEAILALEDNRSADGITLLANVLQIDSNFIDAYLSLAGAYGNVKQYKKAVTVYERARLKDSVYFIPYLLPYSINLAGLGQFDKALTAINQFLTLSDLSGRSLKAAQYRKKTFEFAVSDAQINKNASYVFAPKNLGDSVNSISSEYYPSVTVTDDALVFTRRTGNAREDFMLSTITSKDSFFKAAPLDGDINIEPRKGAITVSQDGDWLFFAADIAGAGLGGFDIYKSVYTPTGWSIEENLGDSINTDFWESSPAISPDKRALYFSSTRPGGYGGADLYVSYLKPNGRWTEAVNMGPTINTAGDEMAPFIHADNQTLYFTSHGLPGYGGSDLFVLKKLSNGKWGIPENMGYPINTIENEGSLAVAADGYTAYYASDREDSRGGLDIYSFTLPTHARPYKTLYVKGNITDAISKKGLPANLELTDNASGTLINKVQTDELGNYFITLPEGKDYTFTVNRKGYLFYSSAYALSGAAPDSTYVKNIALEPIKLASSFVFTQVLFDNNSYALLPASLPELNKLVQILEENPSMHIQISGYTDNIGKPADNLVLSTNRAKSIVNYVSGKGIATDRLSYKGFGSDNPIATNETPEGRALNRRTSFTITRL
jgi:outer membrane protein OmpA-like peptidoglycan-associated protein/tetratricopeptide (TPR) repeat protein